MTVIWIVIRDNGYEGLALPLRAFAEKDEADAFSEAMQEVGGWKVVEVRMTRFYEQDFTQLPSKSGA